MCNILALSVHAPVCIECVEHEANSSCSPVLGFVTHLMNLRCRVFLSAPAKRACDVMAFHWPCAIKKALPWAAHPSWPQLYIHQKYKFELARLYIHQKYKFELVYIIIYPSIIYPSIIYPSIIYPSIIYPSIIYPSIVYIHQLYPLVI